MELCVIMFMGLWDHDTGAIRIWDHDTLVNETFGLLDLELMVLWNHYILRPCFFEEWALGQWDSRTMRLWHSGPMVQCNFGTLEICDDGSFGPWDFGTIGFWDHWTSLTLFDPS